MHPSRGAKSLVLRGSRSSQPPFIPVSTSVHPATPLEKLHTPVRKFQALSRAKPVFPGPSFRKTSAIRRKKRFSKRRTANRGQNHLRASPGARHQGRHQGIRTGIRASRRLRAVLRASVHPFLPLVPQIFKEREAPARSRPGSNGIQLPHALRSRLFVLRPAAAPQIRSKSGHQGRASRSGRHRGGHRGIKRSTGHPIRSTGLRRLRFPVRFCFIGLSRGKRPRADTL